MGRIPGGKRRHLPSSGERRGGCRACGRQTPTWRAARAAGLSSAPERWHRTRAWSMVERVRCCTRAAQNIVQPHQGERMVGPECALLRNDLRLRHRPDRPDSDRAQTCICSSATFRWPRRRPYIGGPRGRRREPDAVSCGVASYSWPIRVRPAPAAGSPRCPGWPAVPAVRCRRSRSYPASG
jgi:hypothetical protein